MKEKKNMKSKSIKYKPNQRVWFLKSMCLCWFISDNSDGETCTVEKVDTGKRMTALYSGIKPV